MSKCNKCGECCKSMILEVDCLDILREPKLAEHAKLMDGDGKGGKVKFASKWVEEYSLPTPCPFQTICIGSIVHNNCSIYKTRPNMCVAFNALGDDTRCHCNTPPTPRTADETENE